MAKKIASDESDAPAIDRLSSHGRTLLYELLLNDRKPIAMVGSGLSVVYGGISWHGSVKRALEYAIKRVDDSMARLDKRNGPPGVRALLLRDREALKAFDKEGGVDAASDKYVALDLCSEALDHVDALGPADRETCSLTDARPDDVTSFRAFMARLYKDDTLFIQQLLIERFSAKDKDKGKDKDKDLVKKIEELEPEKVQQLACRVYSASFLRELVREAGIDAPVLTPAALAIILRDIARASRKQMPEGADGLPMDRRSLLSLAIAHLAPERRRELLDQKITDIIEDFKLPAKDLAVKLVDAPPRPVLDPISRLEAWLNVKRYMTLNFDYTLEKGLILDDLRAIHRPPYGLEEARKEGVLVADGETGGFTRRFPDGLAASTDLYRSTAVGRLFEFALDSADYRAQILHLHGRADDPNSMLLTDGDSNRQYRRDRSARTALEQALDVTLTGNPIIFVGIGLAESDITRALRELVSRGQATAHNPVFAIMLVSDDITEEPITPWRQQMTSYRQYGIHLIHAGLADENWKEGLVPFLLLVKDLKARITKLKRKVKPDDQLLLRAKALALPKEAFCGDRQALLHLATFVCKRETPLTVDQRDRLTDYLDMLKAKLNTYATIKALESIYEGALRLGRERRLPTGTDRAGNFVVPEQLYRARSKWPAYPFRIRDSLLWSPAMPGGQDDTHDGITHGWRHRPSNVDVEVAESAHKKNVAAVCGEILASPRPIVTCFSPLGAGKGQLLKHLNTAFRDDGCPSLIINCNFGIEFDSVLSQTLNFLWRHGKAGEPRHFDRIQSMTEVLNAGVTPPPLPPKRPTLVLAGVERLVDRRGQPVSSQLDLLLSALLVPAFASSGFRLIIVAADGCRDYITGKITDKRAEKPGEKPVDKPVDDGPALMHDDVPWFRDTRSRSKDVPALSCGFLGHLYKAAMAAAAKVPDGQEIMDQLGLASGRSTQASQPNSARSRAIEAMMRVVLNHWHQLAFPPDRTRCEPNQAALDRLRAELDERVLSSMSFIGMPIEAAALDHLRTPGGLIEQIAALRGKDENAILAEERDRALVRLKHFGLVVEIAPFVSEGAPRYVLHRSAMAEIRERIGIRSGDELLSNSFSITLAISMPTDLTVASEDIQRELKVTVGRFRGSWRDTDLGASTDRNTIAGKLAKLRKSTNKGGIFHYEELGRWEAINDLERALRMLRIESRTPGGSPLQAGMEVNIRAAAGVIRSFFSAASLVAQMPGEEPRRDGQLGEFEEHKRRLGHVVNRFREAQRARLRAVELLNRIQPTKAGATALAGLRDIVNRPVSNDPPALYGGELVWLLNERAVIALLQGDLYGAQRGFREAEEANGLLRTKGPGQSRRRIEINRCLLRIERGSIAEARATLVGLTREIKVQTIKSPFEDRLIQPLIESYLGLCDHLGGNYTGAQRLFKSAIRGLIDTEQQRALAVTYIRQAALQFGLHDRDAGNKTIGLGVAVAEAGRQMDILWRARLTSVRGMNPSSDASKILTLFAEARRYADAMDLPRVAIQSLRGEAEFHLDIGDIETASILASQAMTVAARYGMVLQRIALRVLMGRILLRRNDQSGNYLLRRAIAHADRVGYQLQLDRAQEAMLAASQQRRG